MKSYVDFPVVMLWLLELIYQSVANFVLTCMYAVFPGVLVGAFIGSQGESYYAKDMYVTFQFSDCFFKNMYITIQLCNYYAKIMYVILKRCT